MASLNLAEAKARLSELVTRAEGGETVEIMRRGQLAARIVPARKEGRPIDVAAIRAHQATFKDCDRERESSVVRMRRESRY